MAGGGPGAMTTGMLITMTGPRRETMLLLDPSLVDAVQRLAARFGKPEYEIVEDALRRYLGSSDAESNRAALRDLLSRRADAPAPIGDEEAQQLAYEELHAARRER
jgi:hypothetical protein